MKHTLILIAALLLASLVALHAGVRSGKMSAIRDTILIFGNDGGHDR